MTLAATLMAIGRIALGLFFVVAGVRNFLRFAQRVEMATNYGWRLGAAATAAGFATQLVAGAAVMLGVGAVWGALALIAFLIAATALFHNPLMFAGEARLPHIYFTLVNAALVGYCLMVIGAAL
ncbi:MAG: DoxX family membrane protein [Methylobacteriaceae bacterium]|nr:DoxX family membrane protein [Methylobacteriaceae bacterium]